MTEKDPPSGIYCQFIMFAQLISWRCNVWDNLLPTLPCCVSATDGLAGRLTPLSLCSVIISELL